MKFKKKSILHNFCKNTLTYLVSEYIFFAKIVCNVAVSTEQRILMIERILYDSPHYLLNGQPHFSEIEISLGRRQIEGR